MDETIDVTGVDLVKLIKEAYNLSEPQGMGFLHYKEGPLSDSEAQEMLDAYEGIAGIAVSMDYVHGRAVKLTVHQDGDQLYVYKNWFDHGEVKMEILMKHLGVEWTKN